MSETLADFTRELATFYGASTEGRLQKLKGDASTRRYYRFTVADSAALTRGQPKSVIVMHLPETGEALAAGRAQAEAFLDVRGLLARNDIAVPEIYVHDLDRGVMLLEDLGDETFEARLSREGQGTYVERYSQAIDLLADLHERCGLGHLPPSAAGKSLAHTRTFDTKLLRWELDHFREFGLEASVGVLAADARAELDACFDALTAAIAALPSGLVHRDYQSRNLMWAPDGRLVVIDFQDAFIGPAPYDLVALLCDSYVTLSDELQLAMLERYSRRRGHSLVEREQLVAGFRLIAVQRKLKDAGRFVFIDRVRNNPDFLPFFRQSLRYADRALAALPTFAPLRALLVRHMPGFPERDAPAAS